MSPCDLRLAFCDFRGLSGGEHTGEISLLTNHKTKTHLFEKMLALSFLWFVLVTLLLFTPTVKAAQLIEGDSIVAPTNAIELIYAPAHNSLVLKNSASAIMMIDIDTHSSTTHFSNWNFTDMATSPSGNYVFAADYGGENIGYGTPANQSYVHRLDLSSNIWETKTAYIAGNIQAVSDDQFILKSLDQWVTFTNNSWGTGSAVIPLNTPTWPEAPSYFAGVYYGNFRYDVNTGRLLHGSSGSSSQEIRAFRIVDNDFHTQEGSGTYGSAQGYGGTVAFATDGSAFYYGRLQVDPLDVSHNLIVFPEVIYAATGHIAFGNGNYYNAHTGKLSGSMGFQTTVYGLNTNGTDFWAFDSSQNMLRYFTLILAPPTVTTAPAFSMSTTAAIGGGNVMDHGDAPATARGICWNTSANPTLADSCTVDTADLGAFTGSMTGLNAGTAYHVRAYATNPIGTGYGNDIAFFTLCLSSAVQIGATPYTTIQDAITNVLPGDVIMTNTAAFPEDLSFSNSGEITLQGGYDCGFSETPGMSTVGSITVTGTGSVTVANIIIQ